MAESNEDIFDWIMGFEDECLKRVKEEVIKTAEYNFGERGRKIAEKYYYKIEGVEDDPFSELENDDIELCPECAEKAKKMAEYANFLAKINEILCDDKLNEYDVSKVIDTVILQKIKEKLDVIISDKAYYLSDDDKRKLLCKCLMECCKGVCSDQKV